MLALSPSSRRDTHDLEIGKRCREGLFLSDELLIFIFEESVKVFIEKSSIFKSTDFFFLHIFYLSLLCLTISSYSSVNCMFYCSCHLFLFVPVKGKINWSHHVSDCCSFYWRICIVCVQVCLYCWKSALKRCFSWLCLGHLQSPYWTTNSFELFPGLATFLLLLVIVAKL